MNDGKHEIKTMDAMKESSLSISFLKACSNPLPITFIFDEKKYDRIVSNWKLSRIRYFLLSPRELKSILVASHLALSKSLKRFIHTNSAARVFKLSQPWKGFKNNKFIDEVNGEHQKHF